VHIINPQVYVLKLTPAGMRRGMMCCSRKFDSTLSAEPLLCCSCFTAAPAQPCVPCWNTDLTTAMCHCAQTCCADPTFLPLWFDGHITASQAIGKPLVLEEFGIAGPDYATTNAASTANSSATRDPVYRWGLGAGSWISIRVDVRIRAEFEVLFRVRM